MSTTSRIRVAFCVFAFVGYVDLVSAQSANGRIRLPQGTTALEGVPEVQIETTREGEKRQTLDAATAAKHPVRIRVADGRFYRGTDNEPLAVSQSGAFTYLMSKEPGNYVRLRQVNDKLLYVEHLDMAPGIVTYWGELRIVVRK